MIHIPGRLREILTQMAGRAWCGVRSGARDVFLSSLSLLHRKPELMRDMHAKTRQTLNPHVILSLPPRKLAPDSYVVFFFVFLEMLLLFAPLHCIVFFWRYVSVQYGFQEVGAHAGFMSDARGVNVIWFLTPSTIIAAVQLFRSDVAGRKVSSFSVAHPCGAGEKTKNQKKVHDRCNHLSKVKIAWVKWGAELR